MKQFFALLITIAAAIFALAFTFTIAHAQEGLVMNEEEMSPNKVADNQIKKGVFGTIVFLFASYDRVDANINFFDSAEATTGMLVGYRFS